MQNLGMPDEIIGNSDYGYLSYGSFRFGHLNNIINEFAILLPHGVSGQFEVDAEVMIVSQLTQLLPFIKFLTYNIINWFSYKEEDIDFFI